jgi:hypothetical protein
MSGRVTVTPPRLALRWPDEVATSLGVSRSWLYESGLSAELRFWRVGKVRLVLVRELERAVEKLSARWDERPAGRVEARQNQEGVGGRAARGRPRPGTDLTRRTMRDEP